MGCLPPSKEHTMSKTLGALAVAVALVVSLGDR
jgi:hypothetical protein